MSEPLFPAPAEELAEHACDRCVATVAASLDGLRVRGWIAYDGRSFTGKTLKVRICPACQRSHP